MENKHSKGELFEHLSNVIMADNGEGELYKMKAICQVYGRSDEDTPEADKEVRNANIARIVKCWNEYDKLKEDNALLIEALGNLVTIDCQLYKNAHLITEIRTAKQLLNNLKK